MEKIKSITEGEFTAKTDDFINQYEGFVIKTDGQDITIGVSTGQCCCESFGCIMTNDDINDFIGAEIKSITIVDEALNGKEIEELEYLDEGGAMFVNLDTSEGLLQFVAYNGHNGYYGHSAVLVSNQLKQQEYI